MGYVCARGPNLCYREGTVVPDGGLVDGSVVDGSVVDGSVVDGSVVDGSVVDGSAVDGSGVDAFDPCTPNPCQNGGTCAKSGVSGFTCTCVPGFTGPTCGTNINDCSPNPCLNGGSCTDGVNSFTCTCAAGFAGPTCAININDCSPNPCLNGGTCTDGINDFTCTCTGHWHGKRCELGWVASFGETKFMCEGSTGYTQDDSIYCPTTCCNTNASYAVDTDWNSYMFLGDDGTWTLDEYLEVDYLAPTSTPKLKYKIDIFGGWELTVLCWNWTSLAWTAPFITRGAYGVNSNIDQPGDGTPQVAVPAACVNPQNYVRIHFRFHGTDAVIGTDEIKLYESTMVP